MAALLLILSATALGLVLASRVRTELAAWERLGVGLAAGQALLLWVPCLLAGPLGTATGARAGLALLALAAAGATGWAVRGAGGARAAAAALRTSWAADPAARPVALAAAAATAMFTWLLSTHYLEPGPDGALHTAGVTWGDLTVHAALVTRLLDGGPVPPAEHPFMAGAPLVYPFVPDQSVAALASLGLSLRWAFVLSGLGPLVALALVVPSLARRLTGASGAAAPVAALGLFLLGGGLGGLRVAVALAGGAAPLAALHRGDAWPVAGGDLPLLPNVVGHLLVAARGSGFGLALGGAAMLLCAPALRAGRLARFDLLLAGGLAGGLPLVHAHSFVAAAAVLGAWALLSRGLWRRWLWLAVTAGALALPQVAWILTRPPAGGPGMRPAPGFLRLDDWSGAPGAALERWGWGLAAGLGLRLVLWTIGVVRADGPARRAAAPFVGLLLLANVWTFTPSPYENTKLVAWVELAGAALAARWLVELAPRRALLAAGLALGATVSGGLSVLREAVEDARFLSADDVAVAARVRASTPPGALVLTATTLHHPVPLLAGRRVLLVGEHILKTHGLGLDALAARRRELARAWRLDPEVLARWDPAAIVVGPPERAEVPDLDEPGLARRAARVDAVGPWRIYHLR